MTNDIAKQLLQQIKEINEAYAMHLDISDGRMPCSITDDPLNDYSHWHDRTGPYAQHEEEDCFDAYREQRDRAGPPEPDPMNLTTTRAKAMAIDNKTEAEIRKKLNKFIMDLHLEHEGDTGPLIATTLVRTGTAMYFYCENDVAAAGVAVLEAAVSGIEQARNFISLDQFDEAQNATLQ